VIRVLSRLEQRLPFFVRDRGVGFAPDATPTVDAVIVDGAQVSSAIASVEGPVNAGQYAVVLDASGLRVGARVRVLVSYAIATAPFNVQLDAIVTRRVGAILPDPPPLPPVGAPAGLPAGTATRMAFGGNSYIGNYRGLWQHTQHYLGQRLGANTLQLSPPPVLPQTIGNDDGVFPGMTLGGMSLFPTIDQRQGGNTGTQDFVDAVLAQPLGSYDYIAFVSGFLQDTVGVAGIDYEILPGAGGTNPSQFGVILEIKRRLVQELEAAGVTARFIALMTHEGFRPNEDADLADAERRMRLQVLAARQLVSEGVVDAVIPLSYAWSRAQYGAFGTVGTGPTDPVPAYVGLTHTNSNQPGGRNWGWAQRSQGGEPVLIDPGGDPDGPTWFPRNGHQSALGTILNVWALAHSLWGVDPRGDVSFSNPANLLNPLNHMIRADGLRIYGGHDVATQTSLAGLRPYDTSVNPGGPPDSELDLDWSATPQGQIQDRIYAAVTDFHAETTEFD